MNTDRKNELLEPNLEYVRKPILFRGFLIVCVLSAIIFGAFTHINAPDADFPIDIDVTITEGLSQQEITKILKNANIVPSAFYLDVVLKYYFNDSYIQAGTYRFNTPLNTKEIAESITQGLNQSPLVSITLPEGFRARDLLKYLPESFKGSTELDLSVYEGTLFPDTYFISKTTSLEEVISLLQKTFGEKLNPYADEIVASRFSKEDVVILASIIEREAKSKESKHMVSGILQNRLEINMALQADAVFDYILNKESSELTFDDLNIDSPYNLYTHTGLPPTAIANPGIESIEAVLAPAKTSNLYYLTAPDGTFHYAETFEAHKQNKERYLR